MTGVDAIPRWRQRLGEFGRTVDLLACADALRRDRPLSAVEEAGMVRFFGVSVELSWKSLAW